MNLKCLVGKHVWVDAAEDLQPQREGLKTVYCVKCWELEIKPVEFKTRD